MQSDISPQLPATYEGLCPSCGSWDDLDVSMGWCTSCVEASVPAGTCIRCKKHFSQDNNGARRICSICRKVEWFHRNGDALDRMRAEGFSAETAIRLVAKNNRPTCISCGEFIKNGTAGVHIFCRKHDKCKTAARRYRYYRNLKGMNAQEAIEAVKEMIVVESIVDGVVFNE